MNLLLTQVICTSRVHRHPIILTPSISPPPLPSAPLSPSLCAPRAPRTVPASGRCPRCTCAATTSSTCACLTRCCRRLRTRPRTSRSARTATSQPGAGDEEEGADTRRGEEGARERAPDRGEEGEVAVGIRAGVEGTGEAGADVGEEEEGEEEVGTEGESGVGVGVGGIMCLGEGRADRRLHPRRRREPTPAMCDIQRGYVAGLFVRNHRDIARLKGAIATPHRGHGRGLSRMKRREASIEHLPHPSPSQTSKWRGLGPS